jgi:hypothetical protein
MSTDMNAMKTPRPQPFGIGTRTEIRLDEQHLLTLSVRAGDLLRSADGTVWATVDGEPDDILLATGDVHELPRDFELRVSAFGHARLEVYGHGPLQYRMPSRQPARGAIASVWSAVVSSIRPALGSVRALAGST